MKTHTESPVDPKRMGLILASSEDGAKAIRIKSTEPPATLIKAIDQYVHDYQHGKLPADRSLPVGDAPYALGTLWGQQLVRAFGWHWSMITFHQHNDSTAPGVISEDRSLAVYPIHFIMGALKNPGVDVTIALAFNMLAAGTIKGPLPNEFQNLMDGVRHIVPR